MAEVTDDVVLESDDCAPTTASIDNTDENTAIRSASIPEEASKKLSRMVDQLSLEYVLGKRKDWETLAHFQSMLDTKSIPYSLAEIAMELHKGNDTDWGFIVKCLEVLEDQERNPEKEINNNNNNEKENQRKMQEDLTNSPKIPTIPTTLFLWAGIQQDLKDMQCIPTEDSNRLEKFMDIMKEEYKEDFPQVFALFQNLVEAYQQGKEQEILQQRPFTRDDVAMKLHSWLGTAMKQIMTSSGDESYSNPAPTTTNPNRSRKRKGSSKEKTHGRLQELKVARRNLRQVAVDPLQEAREVSNQVTVVTEKAASRGELLYTKKKSATQLQFSQEEEDDIEDDCDIPETHHLSAVPTSLKPRSAAATTTTGSRTTPPSPRRTTDDSRYWTGEQQMALIAALRDYGIGNWAAIRDAPEYKKYWKNKSNVQLKDLFRTMKAGGRIPKDILSHSHQ